MCGPLNHNMLSEVDDAYFLPQSIDKALSVAIDRNTDPDVSFDDMNLADARAWIAHGLEQPVSLNYCGRLSRLPTHRAEFGLNSRRRR